MAVGKLLFILSYLCVGIWGIFLLPFKNTALLSKDLEASKTPTALAQSRPSKWVYRLIILLGCVAFTIIPWHFVLLSLALSFFASRLCSPLYRHQMGFWSVSGSHHELFHTLVDAQRCQSPEIRSRSIPHSN